MSSNASAAVEPRMPSYETKYYTLCSDVDRAFAQDLARRLDLMYEEYARRLVEFVPASGAPKFKVYVFSRKDDYVAFCDGRAPNSCGVTIPGRNVVAAYTEGESRESVRKTLQHEAFHQFAFIAIGPKIPIWLNEGLAQVFEEGLFTGQQFLLGQVTTERVTQLNDEIRSRRLMPFNEILNMTDRAWHDNMNDKQRAATQYTQAWAMTHFLIFAADESGNFRFRARLIDMLRLIHADRDGGDAFAATFGDNLAGFQRRFVEYAGTMRTSPEALCIERQDALADFLAMFHQDGRRFADVIDFRKTLTGGGYRFTRNNPSTGRSETIPAADVRALLTDPQGLPLEADRMFFVNSPSGVPLDDLVCRPMPRFTLRTRFRRENGKIAHETIVAQD